MFRINYCIHFVTSVSKFHTSTATHLNQHWRNAKKRVKNPNAAGPLLTLQDYSFKDNRPTPYGSKQLSRIQKHQEYAKRIIQLVNEVDCAVERHARLLKEEEERKQQILDSKLKPKGKQLITSE